MIEEFGHFAHPYVEVSILEQVTLMTNEEPPNTNITGTTILKQTNKKNSRHKVLSFVNVGLFYTASFHGHMVAYTHRVNNLKLSSLQWELLCGLT